MDARHAPHRTVRANSRVHNGIGVFLAEDRGSISRVSAPVARLRLARAEAAVQQLHSSDGITSNWVGLRTGSVNDSPGRLCI
jgi:hypothetical protein